MPFLFFIIILFYVICFFIQSSEDILFLVSEILRCYLYGFFFIYYAGQLVDILNLGICVSQGDFIDLFNNFLISIFFTFAS